MPKGICVSGGRVLKHLDRDQFGVGKNVAAKETRSKYPQKYHRKYCFRRGGASRTFAAQDYAWYVHMTVYNLVLSDEGGSVIWGQ